MAYQPLSKLISQPPTIKELHITTDNWPKERSRFGNMVRDPQDPNFNWWFWCGISNKQGLLDLVNDYFGCLIECDEDQSTCKRICKDLLETN